MVRRVNTPISSHVAVLHELRWGPADAPQLIENIAERTRGYEKLTTPLVYRALGNLVRAGLVRGTSRADRAARVWQLTAKGKRVAEQEAEALWCLFAPTG